MGQLNRAHDVVGIALHQHDVGTLDCDVGAGADGKAHICLRERRRVIDARLTATANRSILAANERSLQVDLARLDRTVPAAGYVGSRGPCPSTSTQRAATQIPKAGGIR